MHRGLAILSAKGFASCKIMRQPPGGADGVGNGHAHGQTQSLESSHHLLAQPRFSTEQGTQAANVDEQIIGLFNADNGAELLAPAG